MAKSPTPVDGTAADTPADASTTSTTDAPAADASTSDAGAAGGDVAEIRSTTEVRVIRDQGDHRIDDVVAIPNTELQAAVEGGWADAHPSAVAHAKSLKA